MKTFSFLFLTALFFCACQSDKKQDPKTDEKISALVKELETDSIPSPGKLNELIELYEKYVTDYPEKANVNVSFLMKAAEAARNLKKYDKALALYDRILTEYPKNPKAANAYFMKGFTYDNDLNNSDSAKVIYEKFIQSYPKNEFADDAKFLLDNLGKSDEEIIQQFEKGQIK